MSNRGRKRHSETKAYWCLCSICYPIGARKSSEFGPEAVRTLTYDTCVEHCRKYGPAWREVNAAAWEAQGPYPGQPAPPSAPIPANRSPRSGARLASSPSSPPSTRLRLNSTPTRSTQLDRVGLRASTMFVWFAVVLAQYYSIHHACALSQFI